MIMKKVPFVTNEQLKSILEKYPDTVSPLRRERHP